MPLAVKLNNLRIAPRKVRLISDLIRGKSVNEAKVRLQFLTQKTVRPMVKLLNSAIASAKKDFKFEESNLFISKIFVDEGRKLKRFRPRARGQGYEIQKKTSHITIVLDEMEKDLKKAGKPKKSLEPTVAVTEGQKGQKEGVTEEIAPEKPVKEKKPPESRKKFTSENEIKKQKVDRGIRKVFRRKAF